MRKFLLLTGAALLAGGALTIPYTAHAAPPAATTVDRVAETQRMNAWLDAKFEEELDLFPMRRSQNNDKKDYDKIDDFSEEGLTRQLAWFRKSVDDLKANFNRDNLTPDGQTSYDLWIYEYQRRADDDTFRRNRYVLSPTFGQITALPQFLIAIHKVDEPSDMDAYITRIGGVSRALLQLLDSEKLSVAAGTRLPRFAYDAMLAQCHALITGAPFGGDHDSDIWKDAQAKADGLVKAGKITAAQGDAYKVAARKALLEQWQPAYKTLIAWMEADRPNADVIATGVGKNPNGQAYYAEQLRGATTTDLTPEQVHQIGLAGVARIKGEMMAIKDKVGFKGSLQDFFKFIREDDRFYYPNTDVGRQQYIDLATKYLTDIRKKLPQYFGILPKAGVVVKRVEAYREVPGGPQHYFRASADGKRPGVFYAHLSDMHAESLTQLEALAYHEAGLGHHLQFSIAQELKDIPKFRTLLNYNVYQEGWGLYTERLGKEMGGYTDPYSDFGRLSTEIWRAIRLVLDTGIHAKGWTEEQSVKYFLENSPASEGQVRAEVQRYITWPGQATGYMIGMLKIAELRKKAETALGPKFDIRGFHDTILGGSQMTLPLLERRVDVWIAQQKAK